MAKERNDPDKFAAKMKARKAHTPGDQERKQRIAANAAEALRRVKGKQTYEDWRQVGEQLMVITEETLEDLALPPDGWSPDNRQLTKEFTRRFEAWERQVSNDKPLTKQERWALRELMTNPVYHTWYSDPANLTGPERRRLNHPNKIIESYKRKHPDPNKPKGQRQPSVALSPALQGKNKEIEALKERLKEVEEERDLARGKPVLAPFEGDPSDPNVHCSFCGRASADATLMLAGRVLDDKYPPRFICDECVNLCVGVIRDRAKAKSKKPRKAKTTAPDQLGTET